MTKQTAKTTLYLSPSVRKALKRRIIETDQTMSAYVDSAIARAIAQDLNDLEAISRRRGGPTESLDEFMAALKTDGVI